MAAGYLAGKAIARSARKNVPLTSPSPASFAPLLEDLARRTEAAIVFPYFTPAPDKQFPFQFEQTYEVLDYLVRHGSERHLLVQSIALAGDSVGGMSSLSTLFRSLLISVRTHGHSHDADGFGTTPTG